jgi:hypothetical protein
MAQPEGWRRCSTIRRDAHRMRGEIMLKVVVGLFESKGIAEDAINRLRYEGVPDGNIDPPPLKWSTLSYGFAVKEDRNAEEELQAGRDRGQAAAG